MSVYLGTFEVQSPEWYAARAHGIGGSEIAAVLGISPYESRFSLWHRKAGTIGPVIETEQMAFGKLLEPVIGKYWLTLNSDTHLPSDGDGGTYCHDERPWQIANPDHIAHRVDTYAPEVVEVKNIRFPDGWGKDGSDDVPPYYRAQLLWYLDVIGARRGHFAVLFTGMEFRSYVVDYDDAEVSMMRSAAAAFLASIAANTPPALDGSEHTHQAVRQLHPDIDGTDIELPAPIAVAYLDAMTASKDADTALLQAKSVVLDAMGSAQKAYYLGEHIASRQSKKDGTPYLVIAKGVTS